MTNVQTGGDFQRFRQLKPELFPDIQNVRIVVQDDEVILLIAGEAMMNATGGMAIDAGRNAFGREVVDGNTGDIVCTCSLTYAVF